MKMILNVIPGYRSKKVWKMILASIYYFIALLAISGGVGLFLMFLSLPFIVFSLGEIIKNRKQFGKAVQEQGSERKTVNTSLIKFIGALVMLIVGISILPPASNTVTSSQNKPVSENATTVTTKESSSQSPDATASTTDLKSTSQSSQVPTASPSPTPAPSGPLKVHFIDVGQADSILIQSPAGKFMLVDAGNNADGNNVVSYLKGQGVSKIDVLVGTHPHEDHIGGMDTVIKAFDIGSIFMPKVSTTTKTFEDVLNAIKSKNLKINTATAGANIELDSSVSLEMFAPNSSSYEDLNNYSAVIKLSYGKTSFLLAGDAQAISEQEMLSKGYNLSADVLKVGHHGSHSSTTPEFLKVVSPKFAVISVGKGNDYGHPHQETLSKLAAANISVYRTDEAGTIIATSDGETIKFDKSASAIKPQAPPQQTVNNNPPAATVAPSVVAPPAQNDNSDVTVYITKSGEKYHSDGCRYLSKSKIPIKLSDAKDRGYTPCSVCHPPQ